MRASCLRPIADGQSTTVTGTSTHESLHIIDNGGQSSQWGRFGQLKLSSGSRRVVPANAGTVKATGRNLMGCGCLVSVGMGMLAAAEKARGALAQAIQIGVGDGHHHQRQ